MALNFTEPDVRTSLEEHHGLGTAVGYVVRRTFLSEPERLHGDVLTVDGAERYGVAVDVARDVRLEDGCYAVVDTLHSCGCRTAG
jgi:hypothetical protein